MSQAVVIPPDGGNRADFGGLGVHWKLFGAHTGGQFAIVHHPLKPRALAAPLHRHRNEDEYSYVLEGTLGALLGDERVSAGVGTWICKPRGQWHTFWNDSDEPCHIIEVISPAGFEHYFEELATALGNLERMAEVRQKYQLEVDISSVPALCERFGLTFPMRPSTGNQR